MWGQSQEEFGKSFSLLLLIKALPLIKALHVNRAHRGAMPGLGVFP